MDTATTLRPARPQIRLRGRTLGSLTEGLLRLRIAETAEGLFNCEATFGNWGPATGSGQTGDRPGFLYFARDELEFGRDLAVALGDGVLFDGRISALEARYPEGRPPELTVLAEDRFQDLRMTRRSRSFVDVSDKDVIGRIAGDHGLRPQVDLTGPTHKILAQLDQSDLAFMRERARAVGAELWLEGTTLKAATRARRNGGRLRLGHGKELLDFTVSADLAHQRSSVTVTGWDVAGKQPLSERADDAALGSEVWSGVSGASVLGTALAERREVVAHAVPLGGAEARARAEVLFRDRARRFVRGRGIAQTDPRLRVGATVTLDNLGPLFSGDYYVAEAEHRFDLEHGLRTDFVAERAALGRPA